MSVEYSEFKGNEMICLKRGPEDKFGFSFGRTKAKLIVEHYEEIKKFAESEPPKKNKKSKSEEEE